MYARTPIRRARRLGDTEAGLQPYVLPWYCYLFPFVPSCADAMATNASTILQNATPQAFGGTGGYLTPEQLAALAQSCAQAQIDAGSTLDRATLVQQCTITNNSLGKVSGAAPLGPNDNLLQWIVLGSIGILGLVVALK